MRTMQGKLGKAMGGQPDDMRVMLTHHDALIGGLSSRIGHVEKTLGDHGTVLNRIENAVTKQDARPTFDFHKMVGTVVSLAVLFSLIVGGIIYITTSQNSAVLAEQKVFNNNVDKLLGKHDEKLDRLSQWQTVVERYLPQKGVR